MKVEVPIYHTHRFTHDTERKITVSIDEDATIFELKKLIRDENPNKLYTMIAPPTFMKIISNGKIHPDDMKIRDIIAKKRRFNFHTASSKGYRMRESRLLLYQYPSKDEHIDEISQILSFPGSILDPKKLCKYCELSIERVMKILYFLEESGMIVTNKENKDDNSNPTQNNNNSENSENRMSRALSAWREQAAVRRTQREENINNNNINSININTNLNNIPNEPRRISPQTHDVINVVMNDSFNNNFDNISDVLRRNSVGLNHVPSQESMNQLLDGRRGSLMSNIFMSAVSQSLVSQLLRQQRSQIENSLSNNNNSNTNNEENTNNNEDQNDENEISEADRIISEMNRILNSTLLDRLSRTSSHATINNLDHYPDNDDLDDEKELEDDVE